ncbi:hypothetical protein C7C46_33885, partial [Streptomyces tateyamensis]
DNRGGAGSSSRPFARRDDHRSGGRPQGGSSFGGYRGGRSFGGDRDNRGGSFNGGGGFNGGGRQARWKD